MPVSGMLQRRCRMRACAAAANGLLLFHAQAPAHSLRQVRAGLLRNLRSTRVSWPTLRPVPTASSSNQAVLLCSCDSQSKKACKHCINSMAGGDTA